MIILYCIKIFLIITIIGIAQIAYNTFIFRQIGIDKRIKFSVIVVLDLVVGIALLTLSKKVLTVPYLSHFINFVDTLFISFFKYISSNILIIWFVLPMLVIWFVFIGKSIVSVILNRKRFNAWHKKNTVKVEEKLEPNLEKDLEPVSEQTYDLSEKKERRIDFLDVDVVDFSYDTEEALTKVYEDSKINGLQVGKTDTGYVAVYSNLEGINQLKAMLDRNNVHIKTIENRPSIILINQDDSSCISIKEAMQRLKEGLDVR